MFWLALLSGFQVQTLVLCTARALVAYNLSNKIVEFCIDKLRLDPIILQQF